MGCYEIYRYPDSIFNAKLNEKWGMSNIYNENIIPNKYDKMIFFQDGFAKVTNDGKWGLIDKKGNVVYPFTIDFVKIGYLDYPSAFLVNGKLIDDRNMLIIINNSKKINNIKPL